MSEKGRVTVDLDAECYYLDGEFWTSWDHYGEEMADEINKLLNEQEERIKNLKETIIKITIAYHRKHDNTIVNLVDEVHEEDIRDLFTEWNLKPFINLAEDYNLTLNQLFDICSDCIDKLDSTYEQKEYGDVE